MQLTDLRDSRPLRCTSEDPSRVEGPRLRLSRLQSQSHATVTIRQSNLQWPSWAATPHQYDPYLISDAGTHLSKHALPDRINTPGPRYPTQKASGELHKHSYPKPPLTQFLGYELPDPNSQQVYGDLQTAAHLKFSLLTKCTLSLVLNHRTAPHYLHAVRSRAITPSDSLATACYRVYPQPTV